MTRPRAGRSGLLLFVLTALVAASGANGPRFWTVSTSANFLQGRSDGVFVSLQGVVSAGPALTSRLTSSPAQVWSLAEGADGTLWVGTGGDGRVLRVRPGADEEVVFEPDESNVFAIAPAGDRVYAASSPDGQVYAIDDDGTARPFFDPEEQYIWALAVDGNGAVWVGTGTPAVIYRVDPDGTSTEVHRPPADHVVALVPDAAGRMLAGTESPGRLYRFDGDRPFVLLDSGLTELRAIAPGPDGQVFAAAVARGDSAPSDGETTSVAVTIAEPPAGGASGSGSPSRRSVVYRIDGDGGWEALWETPDVVYDLASEGDGNVLAATGPAGRLYRVTADRDVMLFTGVDARQITRFSRVSGDGRPAAFATANPGRVMRIEDGLQSPATYLSEVRDTDSVSTWGLVRWEAEGNVALFTRSGNTSEPDDSWSEWAGPYTGSAGASVSSPSARFLQWKAELTQGAGAAPALSSVTVAYLPRNTRPAVTGITVHPPGVVFQRPFTSDDSAIFGLDDAVAEARRPPGAEGPPEASPGRRMFQKGLQTLQWEASDADDDRLTYSLEYRRDGEATWQPLRTDLLARVFVWDTTAMADGRYLVRVIASDAPTNAAGRALAGDRVSEPVMIDNTPPSVTIEPAGAGQPADRVVVRVVDALSPIERVEFSVRGAPWQLVYPADGLADSPDERYEIPLADPDDRRELVVRATDRLQNVTSQAAGGMNF